MSEGHNFSQIKAAEAPPPGAGDAMGCPLTCPKRVREKKIAPLLNMAAEGHIAAPLCIEEQCVSSESA